MASPKKTHCHRGHPLKAPNLVFNSEGYRQCRTCMNLRKRLARRRLNAAAPALYRNLKALWSEVKRYNIGYEGSELLEIMSDARTSLSRARGDKHP